MLLSFLVTAPDGSDVALLIVYVLLALIFSFLCLIAEAVLLSITPSYTVGIEQDNPKKAELLQRIKQDKIDHSLAAILTLNTIAHTVGAIGAGAQAIAVSGSAVKGSPGRIGDVPTVPSTSPQATMEHVITRDYPQPATQSPNFRATRWRQRTTSCRACSTVHAQSAPAIRTGIT